MRKIYKITFKCKFTCLQFVIVINRNWCFSMMMSPSHSNIINYHHHVAGQKGNKHTAGRGVMCNGLDSRVILYIYIYDSGGWAVAGEFVCVHNIRVLFAVNLFKLTCFFVCELLDLWLFVAPPYQLFAHNNAMHFIYFLVIARSCNIPRRCRRQCWHVRRRHDQRRHVFWIYNFTFAFIWRSAN